MLSFISTFNPILSKIIPIILSIIMLFTPFASVEPYSVKDDASLQMSFTAISDTHINEHWNLDEYKQSTYLIRGLKDMNAATTKPDALVIAGDLTNRGREAEYLYLNSILKHNPTPKNIILAAGNHEMSYMEVDDYEVARQRFTESYNTITGRDIDKLYYSTIVNGYYFLVMGSEEIAGTHQVFSQTQLNWLEEMLTEAETNSQGKPIFVINHNPLKGTNNVDRSWPSGGTVGTQSEEIMEILQAHENVFFITGHLHEKLNADRLMKIGKVHFVNIPCFHDRADFGTGYVFEAYEDNVVIRARDFLESKWRDFEYTIELAA